MILRDENFMMAFVTDGVSDNLYVGNKVLVVIGILIRLYLKV